MKATRLLLPFTHGVDMNSLEYAVLLAKSLNATLVALSLIHVPERQRRKGARLEHIQQSKDFLEAVRSKVERHGVAVERFEVFTSDVVQSINMLVQQMECDRMLLFVRGGDGLLLSADEIEHLLEKGACALYIIRLPSKRNKRFSQLLLEHFSNWLPGRRKRADRRLPMRYASEGQSGQEGIVSAHSGPPDRETTAWH